MLSLFWVGVVLSALGLIGLIYALVYRHSCKAFVAEHAETGNFIREVRDDEDSLEMSGFYIIFTLSIVALGAVLAYLYA